MIVRFVDIDGIDDHHSFNLFSVLYTHSHDIPCGWVGGGGEGYLHNGLNMDQTNAYIYLNVFISSFNLHFVVVVN